jgi:histidine ammonia-lyase
VRNLRHVVAIELMVAAEGLEYRRPLRSSEAVETAHARIRQIVPRWTGDRSPAPDLSALAVAVSTGLLDGIIGGDAA